jgi:hypothetical protein
LNPVGALIAEAEIWIQHHTDIDKEGHQSTKQWKKRRDSLVIALEWIEKKIKVADH